MYLFFFLPLLLSEGAMQMKAQHESQISHLEKENADLRAEKQQEKDRLLRDIETLNQRLNQMQRQLDKQQVNVW